MRGAAFAHRRGPERPHQSFVRTLKLPLACGPQRSRRQAGPHGSGANCFWIVTEEANGSDDNLALIALAVDLVQCGIGIAD